MGKIKEAGKTIKKEVLLNVPNTLTISRLILAFVFALFIYNNYSRVALVILFIITALTDFFDGWTARTFNQKTKIGARLDQYIDRIFSIIIILALLYGVYLEYFGQEMILIVLLVSSREIIGIFGVIIRMIRNKDTYQVRYIGKITCWFQGVTLAAAILGWSWAIYAAIATAVVGAISGFDYLKSSFE